MKEGVVVTGVVLIILGVLLYFSGNNMIEGAPRDFLYEGYSSYESSKSTGNAMVSFGVILGVIGLIVVAYGVTSKDEKEKGVDSRISERFCPNCARVIPFESRVCPFCKHDFEGSNIQHESHVVRKIKEREQIEKLKEQADDWVKDHKGKKV